MGSESLKQFVTEERIVYREIGCTWENGSKNVTSKSLYGIGLPLDWTTVDETTFRMRAM